MDKFFIKFIEKHFKIFKKSSVETLIKLVSAIEYAEAILEITASKLFGEKFKWFIVFLTNLIKCVIRLQLLVIHKIGIQSFSSLYSIKSFLNNIDSKKNEENILRQENINDACYKLKHSGRFIRSIKNSPNLEERTWELPENKHEEKIKENDINLDPTTETNRYIAEFLHIMRPLCHLGALCFFDSKSWKQFFVPLFIDLLSLFLMNGTHKLSKSQKNEMRRRTISFLNYFIRSPIYENFSSSIIFIILNQSEQRIPGSKYITKLLNGYIPQWRGVYSYCWST